MELRGASTLSTLHRKKELALRCSRRPSRRGHGGLARVGGFARRALHPSNLPSGRLSPARRLD
eukprot:9473823-Pyramimonas_sp.AAC.1